MSVEQIIACLALYQRGDGMNDIARRVGVSRHHVHWAISRALQLRRLTGEKRQAYARRVPVAEYQVNRSPKLKAAPEA